MKKLLLILLCFPLIGFGQNVNIPDANFKAYLVGNTAINTNGDTEIQISEASAFNGHINCYNMNISDLTGIEFFTASTHLSCSENQLTSLDVSNNTALTDLECNDNNITNLDLSQNTNLESLACYSNTLITLDLSNNISLEFLTAMHNDLVSLDVRNGNNINMGSMFYTYNNPNLSCVNVDDSSWSTNNWLAGDVGSNVYFSEDCPPLPPSAIQEHTTNKELLKVTDILGRETKNTGQPLLYIYDDGTVEKRITIDSQ